MLNVLTTMKKNVPSLRSDLFQAEKLMRNSGAHSVSLLLPNPNSSSKLFSTSLLINMSNFCLCRGWIARSTEAQGLIVPTCMKGSESLSIHKISQKIDSLLDICQVQVAPTKDHRDTREERLCPSLLIPSLSPPKPEGLKTTGRKY